MADINIYLNEALNALTGGEPTQLPPPSWNIEKYLAAILAKINGEDYEDIPAPSWIIEQRLLAILDALDRQQNTSPVVKGVDPAIVDEHVETYKFSDLGYGDWVSQGFPDNAVLLQAADVITKPINLNEYDYWAETEVITDIKYSDDEPPYPAKLGRTYRITSLQYGVISKKLNKVSPFALGPESNICGAYVYGISTGAYKKRTVGMNGGLYPSKAPAITPEDASNRETNVTVRRTPIWANVTSSNGVFTSEAAAAVDAEHSTVTITTRLYRFKAGTTLVRAIEERCRERAWNVPGAPWSEA